MTTNKRYKLAWLKLPCQGLLGQGETKTIFDGMKDFIAVNGPEIVDGKPYVTVFFWKEVG